MSNKIINRLIWSQLALVGFIGVCTLLMPHFLLEHNEGGVSNYGVNARTIVPYSLAFLLCAGLVLQAARSIRPPAPGRVLLHLRFVLHAYAGLMLLVLATTYPYKLNATLTDLHDLTAILSFWFETIASGWLFLAGVRGITTASLLAAQVVGFGLSLATLVGAIHLLFIAQMVSGLAFGLLLIITARELLNRHVT